MEIPRLKTETKTVRCRVDARKSTLYIEGVVDGPQSQSRQGSWFRWFKRRSDPGSGPGLLEIRIFEQTVPPAVFSIVPGITMLPSARIAVVETATGVEDQVVVPQRPVRQFSLAVLEEVGATDIAILLSGQLVDD